MPTQTAPLRVSIRSYQVGFGDCFLLSFDYGGGKERHVLIDFGSTGLPEGIPKRRMLEVALDIKQRTGGKLTAVVATHRHRDHISGFTTNKKGTGTGDIIRSLKPDIVIQPWTEQPDLAPDAERPSLRGGGKRITALNAMQAVAELSLAEMNHLAVRDKALRAQLAFLGDDNLANRSAVENLMTLAKNSYVFSGKKSGLEKRLPGVRVDVLGPPTVQQTATIKQQRSSDPDEFWQFQARGAEAALATRASLFPRHVRSRGPSFPIETRWMIYHARKVRAEQLLQIVRMLDEALNNTSVILLFRVGKKSLLFPGDAQIENWQFALAQKKYADLLADVDVYKVGHHGSRNATPKSLWRLFKRRSADAGADRLITLMSTMAGMHGHADNKTEVPRETLVAELIKESQLFTTQSLEGATLFRDSVVKF
jgi:hypothetical protein